MIRKDLRLNVAQRKIHDVSYFVKKLAWVAGRGTGKSSYGIGTIVRNVVHFLPRSKWPIIAESFKAMLSNTLPSTISALEGLGYYRDVHYVIGVRPPKHWPAAYEAPIKGYSNVMTWFNGTTFQLVSQDSSATSVRGLNTDGTIVDEALNLDKDHYDEEIIPTIRANQATFSNIPFHLSENFFSSMPYGGGAEWLTDIGKYYLNDGFDYEKIMDLLIHSQMEFIQEQSMVRRESIWKECLRLRKMLAWYPKKVDGVKTFYMESNTFDNIRVLSFDYINRMYRSQSTLRFMTEIMNKRMNKVEGAFYAKFDRHIHTYKRFWGDTSLGVADADRILDSLGDDFNIEQANALGSVADRDCIATQPLVAGMDFGGKINCLVVAQDLRSMGLNRFNIIKDFFVKSPDTIDELVDAFIDYYRLHQNKLIYIYYDSFGNQTVGNSKQTYAEQVQSRLASKGWTVILETTGSNPHHQLKYLLWGNLLGRESDITISLNYYNCSATIHSIEGVKVKEVSGSIKKDKSGEGKHLDTEEKEPHLSDAVDYMVFPRFKDTFTPSDEFYDNRLS